MAWGMLLELVLGISILNIGLTLWVLRRVILELHGLVEVIDARLAAAIQKLVEGGIGDIEPVNPIQQAIAQLLAQRAQAGPIEIPRGPDGKFSE